MELNIRSHNVATVTTTATDVGHVRKQLLSSCRHSSWSSEPNQKDVHEASEFQK